MTRPALHIAVPADAPRDLAALMRAAIDFRHERASVMLDTIVALQELCAEIADREAGYAPGAAESARRLLRPLHTEELNLRALTERSEGDERLARRKAEGFR